MSWNTLIKSGLREFYSENQVAKSSLFSLTLRSTTYATTAYFISLFLEKLLITLCALINGYSVIIKYQTVKVISPVSVWDQESVLMVYLIPFLFQIILYIWMYMRFLQLESDSGFNKLFRLWFMFFLLFRLLGMIPGHLMSGTGIDYALTWIYAGLPVKVAIGILGGSLFFITGFRILRSILSTYGIHNSYFRDNSISVMLVSAAFLPLLASIVFAVLYFLPDFPMEELIGLLLIFALMITFMIKMSRLNLGLFYFKEDFMENKNIKWLVIISLATVLVIRIILDFEIQL